MDAIKGKIQSRQGASITFALMVFLVCAVVSSVVIVSASTVSGRMSGLREMDARYYAVTGVGEELCRIFNGASVKVTKAEDDSEYSVAWDDSTKTGDMPNILKAASQQLIAGGSTSITPLNNTVTIGGQSYSYSVVPSVEGGQLTVDISVGKTAAKAYKLRLAFTSNVKRVNNADTGASASTVEWKLRGIRKYRAEATTTESNP